MIEIAAFIAWLKKWLSSGTKNAKTNIGIELFNFSGNKTQKLVIKKNKAPVSIIQFPRGTPLEKIVENPIFAPLQEAFKEKKLIMITDKEEAEVNDALSFEKNTHVSGLLNFFKNKLSTRDWNLLRTGLYIKHLTEEGKFEQVSIHRAGLEKLSPRELRLVNLASANYYQTYFRPLYGELSRQSNGAELFRKEHEYVLDQMTFAIFVNPKQSVDDVVNKVIKRAIKNIRYGVRSETITIHAMSDNVEIAEKAIAKLRAKFTHIRVKKPAGRTIPVIRALIYYSENRLTQEEFDQYD